MGANCGGRLPPDGRDLVAASSPSTDPGDGGADGRAPAAWPDDIWSIGIEDCVVTIREMKGLRYLRLLLRQPGVGISSLELSNSVSGAAGAGVPDTDFGEVIDRRAMSAYYCEDH